MNLQGLRNALTSRLGNQLLVGQKHAPAILFAAGVIGVGATVVLACRATLKVDEVLQEHEKTQHMIDSAKAGHIQRAGKSVVYTDHDHRRDMMILKARTAGQLMKLYGPSVITGVAAIAALTGSHVVLNRRFLGVTAAYAAVEKGFSEYRGRVVNELGADKDREFRYGLVDKEIVEEGPDGPEVKTIKVVPETIGHSPYVRVFDRTSSTQWQKEPGYNRTFIMCQQEYMNQLLRARGHVFLNDVFDALGLARTPAGAVTGWVLGDCGDGFIDFGVFEGDRYKGMEFVKGDERSVVLDFNVTGVIWDKI